MPNGHRVLRGIPWQRHILSYYTRALDLRFPFTELPGAVLKLLSRLMWTVDGPWRWWRQSLTTLWHSEQYYYRYSINSHWADNHTNRRDIIQRWKMSLWGTMTLVRRSEATQLPDFAASQIHLANAFLCKSSIRSCSRRARGCGCLRHQAHLCFLGLQVSLTEDPGMSLIECAARQVQWWQHRLPCRSKENWPVFRETDDVGSHCRMGCLLVMCGHWV